MPTFVNSHVAIIVASYKDKDFLEACVDSIYRHTPRDLFELVISSDVTDSVTKEYIRKLESGGWCKALFATERRWFTGVNNDALAWALEQDPPFSHFLLLNSDTSFTPDVLSLMLGDMYALNCGIMGCKTLTGDGMGDHLGGAYSVGYHYGSRKPNNGYFQPRVCRGGDWVTGAVFLIRHSTIEKIGFLDEAYPHWGSDREFCRKAQANNIRVGFSPSPIYHFVLSKDRSSVEGPSYGLR